MPPNQSLIEHTLSEMRSDMGEMRLGLQQIAVAITRLAVVEERNKNLEAAMIRIVDQADKLDDRLRNAEITRDVVLTMSTRIIAIETKSENNRLDIATHKAKIDGVAGTMKYVWTVLGGAIGFFALQLFHLIKGAT